MTTRREAWIDRLKGILIFLVVLGHVLGGWYHIADDSSKPTLSFIFKLIYLFHMPAFFFLSGFTFSDSNGWQWYVRKIKRLIVPYFAFGIVSIVIYLLMFNVSRNAFSESATTARYDEFVKSTISIWEPFVSLIHAGGWPNGVGFRCNSVLWFLPCMFSTIVVFKHLVRMGRVALVVVSLLCIMGTIFEVIPKGLPWGVSKLPWFLPYMTLGWFCSRVSFIHNDSMEKKNAVFIWVAILGYVSIAYFIPDPELMRANGIGYFVLYVLGMVGCVLGVFTAKLLTGRFWMLCGASSLGIMLLHKFLVLGLQLKMPGIRLLYSFSSVVAVMVSLVLSVIITIVCFVAIMLIRKYVPIVLGENR